MPANFWGEAVRHAIYVLNRLPTRALSGVTPYEALKNEKPNIGYIKVFGCKAYMKVPNNLTKKLDDRSKSVVNLGKEPGTKVYRLYDPESNRIVVSRDIVFEETEVWPWETQGAERNAQQDKLIVMGEQMPDKATQNNVDDFGSPVMSVQRGVQRNKDENIDGSTELKNYRSVTKIYDSTEPVESQEELLLMRVDEPVNFGQANEEKCWRQAMKIEIDAI